MYKPDIRIYDFDKTIYPSDSMIDFYLFNLRRNPILVRFLPLQIWHVILFLVGAESRDQVKTNFFRYISAIDDVTIAAENFWKSRESKIRPWFKKGQPENVIVTASPEFLINPIAKKLGARLVATKMDIKTGKVIGKNCRGVEKVRRLKAEFSNTVIAEAYGDSKADLHLLKLARKSFLVKHGKPLELKI